MSGTVQGKDTPEPFEIGLVMAGAISAGAYTAGVMDFMVQALDAWQDAKDANEQVPPHEAKIKVMTGASAGGMTAAITVGAFATRCPPVTDPAGADNASNKLFDSWVNRLDIAALLGKQDLADEKAPVKSVLDSTILRTIADQALDVAPAGRRRAYLDEVLHVITTVSNLRGVPYNIPLEGEIKGAQDLYLHADHVHFVISDRGEQAVPGALTLDWQKSDARAKPAWEMLKVAALATGAFPVGLAPRTLGYDFPSPKDDVYGLRAWPIPTGGAKDANGDCRCVDYRWIPPNWPSAPNPPPRYDFLCVDGGLMNNEPLELARQILAGAGCYNPRGPNSAQRAVILIDPFPGGASAVEAYKVEGDLLSVVIGDVQRAQEPGALQAGESSSSRRIHWCSADSSSVRLAPSRMAGASSSRLRAACSAASVGFCRATSACTTSCSAAATVSASCSGASCWARTIRCSTAGMRHRRPAMPFTAMASRCCR